MCSFTVNCTSENKENIKTYKGKANDFTKYPLRIEFDFDNKIDRKCIKQNQKEEITFYCTLSTFSKNIKENKLQIESSKIESLNIEDELFGGADFVYVNRKQLANLSSKLHVDLNIIEQYQIEQEKFCEEFIKEFTSQIASKSFENVPIKEAIQHLSLYSAKDIQPNLIYSELGKVLRIKDEAGKSLYQHVQKIRMKKVKKRIIVHQLVLEVNMDHLARMVQ